MTTLFTTAYAGSGKIDEELVAHHLDQLLPENLGMVYIPDGEIPRRKYPGLTNVIEWLTKEVGTEGTIPEADLLATLVKRRDENEDDVALVLVHDPDNEADVELAKAAHEAGIRVVDLTKAANDMTFEEEPEDTEPPADERPVAGEEETPPWDGDEAPRDPTLDEVLAKADRPSPAAEVARAAALGMAASNAIRAPAPATGVVVQFTINLDPAAISALADAIVASMGRQAEASVAALTVVPTGEGVAPVIPIGTTGIASSDDAAGQPPDTSVYYYNAEKASYRPARGKARAGETRVFLTVDDIKEARAKGMLG